MNRILIYGNSETCPPCGQLKNYLDTLGEPYEFKDLSNGDKDDKLNLKREIFKLFLAGEKANIPVVLIDDNPKIVGFDSVQIDKINEYLAKR